MIEALNAIRDEFIKQPSHKRYEFISKLKRYFVKKPELKGLYHHDAFITMLEFHLDQLKFERKIVNDFLNKLTDIDLDGADYQPSSEREGRSDLIKEISERSRELDVLITTYEKDLQNRKEAQ